MEQHIKNPGLAAVCSFIFSGLGQLYNGQISKGLTIIFFSSCSIIVLIIGSIFIGFSVLGKIAFGKGLILGAVLFFVGLIFVCVIGIYSIRDAYNTALKK